MRRYLQKIARGSLFQRSMILLTGSTIISQAVTVLFSPVITRVYAPADFGIFASYSFLFLTLLTVNSLRYEFAIPLPDNDDEALHIVGMALALVVLTSAGLVVCIAWFGDQLLAWLSLHELGVLIWVLPVALLTAGAVQIFDYWAARAKAFQTIARARYWQTGGLIGSQIAIGLLIPGPLGLLLSQPIGYAINMCILVLSMKLPLRALVNWRGWKAAARKYAHFPLFSTGSSLIEMASMQLPALILNIFFTPTQAGYFALAMRILVVPSYTIGQAVAKVFYPVAADHKHDLPKQQQIVKNFTGVLLVVGMPLFGFIALNGELLFSFLFGPNWGGAGLAAAYLTPWFFVTLITSPLNSLALIFNRQKTVLIFGIIAAVIRVSGLLIGVLFNSAALSVLLFALATALVYLIYGVWMLGLVNIRFSAWLRVNQRPILLNGLVIGVGVGLHLLQLPAAALIVSGIGFGLLFVWFGQQRWRLLQDD